MTPERWQQITGIFHLALAREPQDRAAFVSDQCRNDQEMLREVEAMLAAHDGSGPLSNGAVALNAPALVAGARFGSYEVVSLLGAGGMGEVYRARDLKLHRDVALKVLLPSVSTDAGRLARFASEARVLATLNHPHIAQAYGFEDAPASSGGQGVHALVMEFVDGPTLAERLARGPLPIDDALAIARQIAEALEAAHEKAIVHRDLKPANIKVRQDGTVKVLDFGLAKALNPFVDRADASRAATAADLTAPGMIVGTAAYMSPEQAKGQPVDRRTDMWAFGCVIFETLTGHRAFDAEHLPAVLVKIVSQEPDWNALPPGTPAAIRTLLRRCLEKDPKRRLDSAAAARIEIDDAVLGLRTAAIDTDQDTHERAGSAADPRGRSVPRPTVAGRLWPAALVAVIGLGAVAVWFGASRRNPMTSYMPRFRNAVQVTATLGVENYPAWSPDGTRIAYHASDGGYGDERDHDVWVSQLGRSDPVNLTNGEGDNRSPSWSPDGREIAFYSKRSAEWAAYTMPAIGGRPRQILPLPGIDSTHWSAPQWSRDGSQLHISVSQGPKNHVYVVSMSSLQSTRVDLPDHDGTVVWDLNLRPDGQRYAYVAGGGGQTEVTQLWTISVSGGAGVALTDGWTNVWSPTWAQNGRDLYYISNRGGAMDLWHQALRDDGTAVGEPVAITQGLGIRSAAFSADGKRLAYSRGAWVSNVWRVPLLAERPSMWTDAVPITSEHAFVEFVDISPDGSQLTVSSDRRGNQDLYAMSSQGGEMTQLTTDPAADWQPRWSPDGRQIVFYSARSGNRDIWVMPSSGGPARQLTFHPRREAEPSWSPDGRDILFRSRGPQAAWIVSAEGGEPRLLAEGFRADPSWSPDGSWVLLSTRGALYRVARSGGTPTQLPFAPKHSRFDTARFSRDGQSLYYSVVSGPKTDLNVWKLSLVDGAVTPVTKLEGRRGNLSYYFAVDARYLYFTWREDDGDIWVMDVANADEAQP